MKKTYVFLSALFSVLMCCFIGCGNSVNPSAGKDDIVYVTGTVKSELDAAVPQQLVTSNNVTARTAMPVYDEGNVYYKITVTDESNSTQTFYSDTSDFTVGVKKGTAKFRGYCYAITDNEKGSKEDLIFDSQGEVEVFVTDSETTVGNLPLKIVQSGTGTVNLPICIESFGIADQVFVSWVADGNNYSQPFNFSESERIVYFDMNGREWATGVYELKIEFKKNGSLVYVCKQNIVVLNKLETNIWLPGSGVCINEDCEFYLTASHVLYKTMKDFYVDPSASDSKELGTPYNPFKTFESAFNTIQNYGIENATIYINAQSDVPVAVSEKIEIYSECKCQSITISSYNTTVERPKATVQSDSSFIEAWLNCDSDVASVFVKNIILDGNNVSRTNSFIFSNKGTVTLDNVDAVNFNKSFLTVNGGTGSLYNCNISGYFSDSESAPVKVKNYVNQLKLKNVEISNTFTDYDGQIAISCPGNSDLNNSINLDIENLEITGKFDQGISIASKNPVKCIIENFSTDSCNKGIYINNSKAVECELTDVHITNSSEYGIQIEAAPSLKLAMKDTVIKGSSTADIYTVVSGVEITDSNTVDTVLLKKNGEGVLPALSLMESINSEYKIIFDPSDVLYDGDKIIEGNEYLTSENISLFTIQNPSWSLELNEGNGVLKTNTYKVFYVAGSGATVLQAPSNSDTANGTLALPFTSVQKAVEEIGSGTGIIYVDGVVEDEPQSSNSDSKCTVQITNGANITILGYGDGGTIETSAADTRVMAIWDPDKNTTVTLGAKLTIKGGNVTTSNCGGGIVNGATLVLDGCTITENKVIGDTAMGGGVYCNQESVTTIKPGTVISNNTSGKFGGGLTVCGGTLNIEGGTFKENQVSAADGAGSDIQLKVFEDWTGGTDTGDRQKSIVYLKDDISLEGTILLGFDTSDSSPQTILITNDIENEYKIDLDSNIQQGMIVADKAVFVESDVFSKLKITGGDLYVDSEGVIREKSAGGSIDVGNIDKTLVDIGTIDNVFFSKSNTAKNTTILTLSEQANSALGVSGFVTFQLYSTTSEGNALIDSAPSYVSQGTARYQLQNLQSIEVGEYKLHVSAVSNDEKYVIESKTFTITVGY